MAEPLTHADLIEEALANAGADVEMGEGVDEGQAGLSEAATEVAAAGATTTTTTTTGDDVNTELPFAESDVTEPPTSFASYLASPVVTLVVGGNSGNGAETVLTAHQALLSQSPFLRARCAEFSNGIKQIDLPDEAIDAVGCFLEYLYTKEYFPRKLAGQRTLETDSSMPLVDDTGEQLLKHARVYTLADRWGVGTLKALASSKIHCVNSTAKGEIAYARYVYAYTNPDDSSIRAPVANFWATRSHTLRAEAEVEFKALCLEHPQFGYDVLTRVLDEKLKRERNERSQPSSGSQASARKRARHSNI